jgi:sigma-E factor negative regulatory protein RseA
MSNQFNNQVVNIKLHALERLSATLDAEDIDTIDQLRMDDLLAQQQDWELYHLIGDVMRSPELALKPVTNLTQKIAFKIDQEPALSSADVKNAVNSANIVVHSSRWQRYWPSLAMAAALASVVWVAQPIIKQMEGSQNAAQFARAKTESITSSTRLYSYVRAHRDLSGPAVVQTRPVVDGTVK